MDHCCIFGRIVHICSRYYLIRRRCDRQECERAIAAWRSRWDFVHRKANEPKSFYSCKKTALKLLKRHWGVSMVVYSIIWTNPFDDLSSYTNREWINVVSTRSTGFRTNKRYASLPADVLWGSFVTHSFLPEMNAWRTNPKGRLPGG